MAIPRIQELYNPILGYLLEYNQDTLVSIRHAMMDYFYMTSEEAFEREDDSNKYTLFEWRVNRACTDLFHAGLLLHPIKGVYAISQDGKRVADSEKDVDRDYLLSIESFREYERRKRVKNLTEVVGGTCVDRAAIREKEYVEIKEVSIENIVELKKQDARFANMMAAGIYMLEGGQIREVPIEVLQYDMSYKEYCKTTLSHSASNLAFTCKADVGDSGKMKAVKHRNRAAVPGGTGPRPRKWESPEPFVKTSIDKAVNRLRGYKSLPTIMDAMNQLINVDYKISYAELGRRTGISEDKIRNMCTSHTYNPKFLDLTAIFIKLKVPSPVCRSIFSLAGFDITTKKYEKHFEIIEIGMHHSASEINDFCVSEGIDAIFPATIVE